MKRKNSPTATNEASRSRRGREPVSRPLFLSPQQEAEVVAKKVIRRLMQCQVSREESEELREAYRREKQEKHGMTERERRYLEMWGDES